MLALVKTAAGPGLSLETVPDPAIGINDVLIRVHRTGICGTDLHIEGWDAWAAKTIHPPLVVGHEFVGEIVEVGSNVYDFAAGDIVSGEGHVTCGLCRHCLAGRRHLCAHMTGLGVGRDGAFAEYVAAADDQRLAPLAGHRHGRRRDLRPLRQRRAHRTRIPGAGRGRADHGRRSDRAHGAAIVRHAGARFVVVSEPNPVPSRAGRPDGRHASSSTRGSATWATSSEIWAWSRASTSRSRCRATPAALRTALDNMAHGGNIAILVGPELRTGG